MSSGGQAGRSAQRRRATPHWSSPLPLPGGTTRHAAAYHPCQPSPPGNVAAFSATPSGVPAAPQNTAAGRGRGQRGRCPPQSQEEAAGPLPQRPFGLEVGRGLGKRAAGALILQEEASSIRIDGRVAVWAAPVGPLPSLLPHSTADARSTGLQRIPTFLPFPSNQRWGRAEQTAAPSPCSCPRTSPACPPQPGRPRETELEGGGRGMDAWVLIHPPLVV